MYLEKIKCIGMFATAGIAEVDLNSPRRRRASLGVVVWRGYATRALPREV